MTKNTQIKFVTGPGSPLLLKGTRQVGRSYTLKKQVILDFSLIINFDELVKSQKAPFVVIPAKAGIQ